MPERSSKPKSPPKPKKRAPKTTQDENLVAARVFGEFLAKADPDAAPPPKEKNAAAVALGRLGGAKGGPARAAKLSPKKRAAIAKKAAKARWSKVT
jgi:hypothetical protein